MPPQLKFASAGSARGALERLSLQNSAQYGWFSHGDSLSSRQHKADCRRQQLLDTLNDSSLQQEEKDSIAREWIALLKERDRILKLKLDQENEESREEFLRELNVLLQHLPAFNSTSSDQRLLNSLLKFRSQVGEYYSTHNLSGPPRRCISVPTLSPSSSYPLPPAPTSSKHDSLCHLPSPPSPPPQCELPVDLLLYPNDVADKTSQPRPLQFPGPSKVSLAQAKKLPADPVLSSQPLQTANSKDNEETDCPSDHLPVFRPHIHHAATNHSRQSSLLEEITHHKDKLKRTNSPHVSGGRGTPQRTRYPQNSEIAHSDMLQRALKKKFRNVHAHSTPKRHGSSYLRRAQRGSGSVSDNGSIECSDIEFGEGGYASDPDLSLGTYSDIQTSSARSAGDIMIETTCDSPSLGTTHSDKED